MKIEDKADQVALVAEALRPAQVLKDRFVGSAYILGEGKDVDYLVLVGSMSAAIDLLAKAGYVLEGAESYDTSTFSSLRKDGLNVLITQSFAFFEGFAQAAEVCKYLGLKDREQRVKVHRILLDGESSEDPEDFE